MSVNGPTTKNRINNNSNNNNNINNSSNSGLNCFSSCKLCLENLNGGILLNDGGSGALLCNVIAESLSRDNHRNDEDTGGVGASAGGGRDAVNTNPSVTISVDDIVNSKVINPMIRRIQRMQLNAMRDEMDILDDLERLPQRVNEVYKATILNQRD